MLLVLVQLLGVVHFALVRHAVCWTHGEYTHVVDTNASRASHLDDGTAPSHWDSAAWDRDDADEHCAALAHRREQDQSKVVTLRVEPPMPLGLLVQEDERRRASVQPIFRIAPKQSPPV